jgi:hypothetical protein
MWQEAMEADLPSHLKWADFIVWTKLAAEVIRTVATVAIAAGMWYRAS